MPGFGGATISMSPAVLLVPVMVADTEPVLLASLPVAGAVAGTENVQLPPAATVRRTRWRSAGGGSDRAPHLLATVRASGPASIRPAG